MAAAALSLVVGLSFSAGADQSSAQKRAALSSVHRILILPPIFGAGRPATATTGVHIDRASPAPTRQTDGSDPAGSVPEQEYRRELTRLEEHADTRLPARLAARTPFQPVSESETAEALKSLKLTPELALQNGGRIRNGKFPLPDAAAVRKLASATNADAVLLTVLDEPRRSNGHYFMDLSGLDYSSPHVRSKAAFYLVSANGTEALHDYIEVLHPLTKIGSREFTLVDWREAEDQVIENFMDELALYSPAPASPEARPTSVKGKEL